MSKNHLQEHAKQSDIVKSSPSVAQSQQSIDGLQQDSQSSFELETTGQNLQQDESLENLSLTEELDHNQVQGGPANGGKWTCWSA